MLQHRMHFPTFPTYPAFPTFSTFTFPTFPPFPAFKPIIAFPSPHKGSNFVAASTLSSSSIGEDGKTNNRATIFTSKDGVVKEITGELIDPS